MATISDLETRVLNRLEEPTATFWSLPDEIRVFLVEAMNEAALISGEPEVRQTSPTPITLNQTIQAAPADSMGIVRIEGPNSISVRKVTLWDMDRMIPSWEKDTDASLGIPGLVKYWFPLGLTQWGIYPQLTNAANVILNYIQLPVSSPRPYTGAETIPFRTEYFDAFTDYAEHVARLKEGGQEFFDSISHYDRFLATMTQLSKYADRIGSLRFSKTKGAPSGITPVTIR